MAKKSQKDMIRRLLSYEDRLGGEDIVIDMYDSLRFTDDMDAEMEDVLIGYQTSGMLEAQAETRFDILKVELDQARGELDDYAREMEVINRPTDQKVKAWIDRNPQFIERRKALAKARERHAMLKHFNRAFYMKSELLRTRAANIRNQEGFNPSIPEKKPKKKNKKSKQKQTEE